MTATPTHSVCPQCAYEFEPDETKCPNCIAHQRTTDSISDLALDFYNKGLDRARAGDREGALEKVRGAIAANPADVDAHIVLGKLLAQSKQPADLQEAIAQWNKARALHPTEEQARKIDKHLATADANLSEIHYAAAARQRGAFSAFAFGALLLAGVCGAGGYFLHNLYPGAVPSGSRNEQSSRSTTSPGKTTGSAALSGGTVNGSAPNRLPQNAAERMNMQGAAPTSANAPAASNITPPIATAAGDAGRQAAAPGAGPQTGKGPEDQGSANPVAAINKALACPDITVVRTGDRFVLIGKVTSISEKRMTVAAAAYAAKITSDSIDASQLKVKPDYVPVGSARVQTMLNAFIDGLGRNGHDPLTGAKLRVLGGIADTPLQIIGTCSNAKAPSEVAALIKEVYPSANAVDVTGMKVQRVRMVSHTPISQPPVRRQTIRAHRQAVDSENAFRATAEALRQDEYSVQPGDTIFRITRDHARQASDWRELWNANKAVLKDPQYIPAGTVLKLPHSWRRQANPTTDGQ